MAPVDTTWQWREDWSLASVVSHSVVTDPTIRQPGFDLPRHVWSQLNRFRTGQGPCHANLHKWGLVQSPSCDCGQRQTMNHIVDTCPLKKFEDGLKLLHEVDDDTVIRLESTATTALVKWKNNHQFYCNPHQMFYLYAEVSVTSATAAMICCLLSQLLHHRRHKKTYKCFNKKHIPPYGPCWRP